MSLVFPGQVREDAESGQYYADKTTSVAFRFFPVWLNRVPTMAKYAIYQNPDMQALWTPDVEDRFQKIGKGLGYFALNYGGLVREYQLDPTKELRARQARLKFSLERTKEEIRREAEEAPRLIPSP